MMNLSNDLNMLATSNVLGCNSCSNPMRNVGFGVGGYNPYGVGALNPQLNKDVYNPSSKGNKIAAFSFAACGIAFFGKIFSNAINSLKRPNKKGSFVKNIKSMLGIKSTKKSVKKTAAKGVKGVLSKIGKCFKTTALVAGLGTLAVGGLRLYQGYKNRTTPLNIYEQPQDTVSFSQKENLRDYELQETQEVA